MGADLIVTVAEAQERMEELIELVCSGQRVIIRDRSLGPVELVPALATKR